MTGSERGNERERESKWLFALLVRSVTLASHTSNTAVIFEGHILCYCVIYRASFAVSDRDANLGFPFCTVKASGKLDITVIPWAACTSKTTTVYSSVG